MNWPKTHTIHLTDDYTVDIPLTDLGGGFYIYTFDLTGETEWNCVAARALKEKLAPYKFDGFMTVQVKACGLSQAINTEFGFKRSLELRKSLKAFMTDPVGVSAESITTHGVQELWVGREKYDYFKGKRLCFLDDVVSTGGTINAALELAKKIDVEVAVVACALVEGEPRTDYNGIPLVCLDTIPLPGKI